MSPTARLGSQGPLVPRIGLGLMGMSVFYGTSGSDEDRFVVLDKAIEVGETFWDSESSIFLCFWTSSLTNATLFL